MEGQHNTEKGEQKLSPRSRAKPGFSGGRALFDDYTAIWETIIFLQERIQS